ncbi:MAG: single-stranded DNA-binding protein [Bacilli bacterium]|nr:single-stranded DNA-binding protein [Bacilli bacterium]
MLNQTVIVGRLVADPQIYETENGSKVSHVTVAVPRSFKNIEGEYDTDYISCVLWRGVAENTATYCKKGDLVGVRGRLQTREFEVEEEKRKTLEVVAEKITFLSSKRKEPLEED